MPDSLLPPPRNPVTPTLDQLVSAAATARDVGHAAVVQPVQDIWEGVKDLAAGQGVTPSVGAGAFAAMGLLSPMKAGVLTKGIRAYHGSPYKFDKFSLDKIGTGEGAQAYGHGLYFAENEGVAKSYRDQLGGAVAVTFDGKPIWERGQTTIGMGLPREQELAVDAITRVPDSKWAIDFLNTRSPTYESPGFHEARLKAVKLLEEGRIQPKTSGHLYEVNINARPEQFLDWDRPLAQQGTSVQGIMRPIAEQYKGTSRILSELNVDELAGEQLLRATRDVIGVPRQRHTSLDSALMANHGGAQTSQFLNQSGIPGIKYLDQGSRDAGEGSSNYVVFDDKLIDILKRYGIAGLGLSGLTAASQGDWNYQQKAPLNELAQ